MAITRQQRDHLRARVLTLEAERDSLREEVGDKTRKCDTLYTDNIKLLEQKKYWQSMSGLSTSSSTSSSNGIESILPSELVIDTKLGRDRRIRACVE